MSGDSVVLTDDDYVTDIDTSTNTTRTLDPGNYLLVVGVWYSNTVSDASRNYTGTYSVEVDSEATQWATTRPTASWASRKGAPALTSASAVD